MGSRGPIHLLAAEEFGWLLIGFGSVSIAGARLRHLELGLDDEICDILAGRAIAMRSIYREGQAKPHLIFYAAMQGTLCLGPDRGSKPAYVLLNDWIGHVSPTKLLRETTCVELAWRYHVAYGRTSSDDMVA